ncbi:MAG TPA: SurA N-terminal domain-containing protein [Geminicoccaceae bacterium]|jgi:peptidyl-prolyl cis-trans isomerase D|nr:SurA N-terminal domain-containing protein [Geminicoccaceae bacterium]
MLNALRRNASSWVVKVLLLLLVVSFAIWGIGDIFYGGGQNPTVATVGDAEIPANELAEAFNRAVANLQRQLGPEFDRERAIQLGVMQQTLQDLIRQRLISLEAQELGLVVPDDALRTLVTEDPMFQSAGQFDRGRFDQLLRASGLSEEAYLASLRQQVVRQALTGSIAGPVAAPAELVDAIYRHRNEKRRGHYIRVPTEAITDVPAPSDEELAQFHEARQAEYTAPEYRSLTFVALEAEDLLGEIEVSDEEVEAAYQSRMEEFRTPERRTVAQLLAAEPAPIEQAAERVAAGSTFEQVASDIEGVSVEQLGTVSRGDLPADFEEAVFALAEGEVSDPVESAFGWHLFRVTKVEPEHTVPLAEVRERLSRELALQHASERLPDFAAQLDDELAAGTELKEAAGALGLEIVSVPAVDATGKDPEGKPVESLPPWPEFMQVALETGAGETSLLEETDAGGYFVVHVEDVTAPRLKPVEEVRDQLVEAWQAQRRRELARERAEELRARLGDGAALDELLAGTGFESKPIEPLQRDAAGTDQGINRGVVQTLFATAPGEVAAEVIQLSDGFAVVATDEVIPADPAPNPEGREQLARELEGDMRSDLVVQFEAQLRREYPIEIDGAAINRLIGEGFAPIGAAGTPPGGPS